MKVGPLRTNPASFIEAKAVSKACLFIGPLEANMGGKMTAGGACHNGYAGALY